MKKVHHAGYSLLLAESKTRVLKLESCDSEIRESYLKGYLKYIYLKVFVFLSISLLMSFLRSPYRDILLMEKKYEMKKIYFNAFTFPHKAFAFS